MMKCLRGTPHCDFTMCTQIHLYLLKCKNILFYPSCSCHMYSPSKARCSRTFGYKTSTQNAKKKTTQLHGSLKGEQSKTILFSIFCLPPQDHETTKIAKFSIHTQPRPNTDPNSCCTPICNLHPHATRSRSSSTRTNWY